MWMDSTAAIGPRIELPAAQEHLLEALGATGKPLIVVLTAGSALAVPWAKEHADALLAAWYPGEEGGDAIAETLTGDEQSRRAAAGHILSFDRRSACVYRLLDEEQDLPLFQGRGLVSFRIRVELFEVQSIACPR